MLHDKQHHGENHAALKLVSCPIISEQSKLVSIKEWKQVKLSTNGDHSDQGSAEAGAARCCKGMDRFSKCIPHPSRPWQI